MMSICLYDVMSICLLSMSHVTVSLTIFETLRLWSRSFKQLTINSRNNDFEKKQSYHITYHIRSVSKIGSKDKIL